MIMQAILDEHDGDEEAADWLVDDGVFYMQVFHISVPETRTEREITRIRKWMET